MLAAEGSIRQISRANNWDVLVFKAHHAKNALNISFPAASAALAQLEESEITPNTRKTVKNAWAQRPTSLTASNTAN